MTYSFLSRDDGNFNISGGHLFKKARERGKNSVVYYKMYGCKKKLIYHKLLWTFKNLII
jgi:hypothetical protein